MGKGFKGTRLYDYDYSGTTFDDDTIDKLCEGALIGCNHSELCLYANVSHSALYRFYGNNPDFKDKIELLRNDTAIKARMTVRQSIIGDHDPITAKWYLERKVKDEFTAKADIAIQSDNVLTIEDKEESLKSFLTALTGSQTVDEGKSEE